MERGRRERGRDREKKKPGVVGAHTKNRPKPRDQSRPTSESAGGSQGHEEREILRTKSRASLEKEESFLLLCRLVFFRHFLKKYHMLSFVSISKKKVS